MVKFINLKFGINLSNSWTAGPISSPSSNSTGVQVPEWPSEMDERLSGDEVPDRFINSDMLGGLKMEALGGLECTMVDMGEVFVEEVGVATPCMLAPKGLLSSPFDGLWKSFLSKSDVFDVFELDSLVEVGVIVTEPRPEFKLKPKLLLVASLASFPLDVTTVSGSFVVGCSLGTAGPMKAFIQSSSTGFAETSVVTGLGVLPNIEKSIGAKGISTGPTTATGVATEGDVGELVIKLPVVIGTVLGCNGKV